MDGLAENPACLALYPFDEGSGSSAASIVGSPPSFYIPPHPMALITTLFDLPHTDMRATSLLGFPLHDFLKNIFFFFPFGVLLSYILSKNYTLDSFALFLIVTAAGGLFSITIEFLQLFLPSRTAGIPDIISNMIGSGLGVVVMYILNRKKRPPSRLDNSLS